MLSTVPVRNLGLGGLSLDKPAVARTFETVHGGTNFRIDDGALAPLRQPQEMVPPRAGEEPLHADAFYLSNDAGGHVLIYESGRVDFIFTNGVEINLGAMAPSEHAHLCQVGDMLIITNGIEPPWTITEESLSGGGQLVPMANWPADYTARFFATFRNFIVAGGVAISGAAQGSMVKWSHPYSPGDGQIWWDHTDPTLLAGENQLGTAGKDIEGLQPLRDFMMVYCDEQTYRMEYVGGVQVMSFPLAWDDDGAVGPHAFASRAGKALVVGYHDIYAHDGYQVLHLGDGRITRSLYRTMQVDRTVKVTSYPHREEVWIAYRQRPDESEINTRILIYHANLNAFTPVTLDTAAVYVAPRLGQKDVTYDQADINYGADPVVWSFDGTPLTFASVGNADDAKDLYIFGEGGVEVVDVVGTGLALPGFSVQWGILPMAGLFETVSDRLKLLQRIYPLVEGEPGAALAFRVSTARNMNVQPRPGAWVGFDADTQEAVDVRESERWLGLDVKAQGRAFFRLAGFDMEVHAAGRQ